MSSELENMISRPERRGLERINHAKQQDALIMGFSIKKSKTIKSWILKLSK